MLLLLFVLPRNQLLYAIYRGAWALVSGVGCAQLCDVIDSWELLLVGVEWGVGAGCGVGMIHHITGSWVLACQCRFSLLDLSGLLVDTWPIGGFAWGYLPNTRIGIVIFFLRNRTTAYMVRWEGQYMTWWLNCLIVGRFQLLGRLLGLLILKLGHFGKVQGQIHIHLLLNVRTRILNRAWSFQFWCFILFLLTPLLQFFLQSHLWLHFSILHRSDNIRLLELIDRFALSSPHYILLLPLKLCLSDLFGD